MVTPYAGVWIETKTGGTYYVTLCVTPYAGVWIETFKPTLKQDNDTVTPYAGVWIETRSWLVCGHEFSHSLRGSVD